MCLTCSSYRDTYDLADGNAIRQGERSGKDALSPCKHIIEACERVERLRLVDRNFEGAVFVDRLHVDTQVVEDLQRKVAEWHTRALQQFAWV